MGTGIQGRIGIAFESSSNPGEVLLLADTAVASLPVTLTIQPNAVPGAPTSSGMRLFIQVRANIAVGTITVTGKDYTQTQGAATETTTSIPVAGTGSNPTGVFEYCTSAIFSTIDASGVTVSGLTGGVVRIYGIQAASKLIPAMMESEEKFNNFSPEEQRGLTSRHTNIQQLNKQVELGKFEGVFRPDNCLFVPYMAVGDSPASAHIPASPTVLKTTTAVAGGPLSLTTQPNTTGPGSFLQFVVTASSAVGTITVTGTDPYGMTIAETILCGRPAAANGNGTFYSQQIFASVASSGITFTALTAGSVAVNGIIAEQLTWLASDSGSGGSSTLKTAAIEWYTGTDAVTHPFAFFEEVTVEGGTDKEIKWSAKGQAQDMLSIGDRSVAPMTAINAMTPIGAIGAYSQLWQPFDWGMSGWQVAHFIDAISGTPGTTPYNQILSWKYTFKRPQDTTYTGANTQRYNKLYAQQRETELELTITFDDLIQYEKFRQGFAKLLLQTQLIGPICGVNAGVPVYKSWVFTFASKIDEAKRNVKMGRVEGTFKLLCEYTPALNYEYKLVVITQQPPTYAA